MSIQAVPRAAPSEGNPGYSLPAQARQWQAKARRFAEELIPHEMTAELNEGRLPPEVERRHQEMATGLGLSRMDVPVAQGGLDLSMLEQAVVWEQLGKVTNALAWCFSEPRRWMFEACSPAQIECFIRPLMTGARRECY